MPRGRSVKDDVIERRCSLGVADQQRELVEGGDLGRAGPGQPFLKRRQVVGRQDAAIGCGRPLPIVSGRLLRVDVHRLKVLDAGDRSRGGCQFRLQNRVEI